MPSIITNPRSLNISFIRKVDNSKMDDIFSVVPNGACDKMFNIAYRDAVNKIRCTNTVNEYEVYDFLENMFTLLPLDEDPFRMIQITAPSFPPVMLNVDKLSHEEVRESIANVVKNTIRNWPDGKKFTNHIDVPLEEQSLNTRPVTRSMSRAI
jgi:hypothetical protein